MTAVLLTKDALRRERVMSMDDAQLGYVLFMSCVQRLLTACAAIRRQPTGERSTMR